MAMSISALGAASLAVFLGTDSLTDFHLGVREGGVRCVRKQNQNVKDLVLCHFLVWHCKTEVSVSGSNTNTSLGSFLGSTLICLLAFSCPILINFLGCVHSEV